MAMLEIKDISIRFGGVQALDDVTFSLKHGEILGLIGPNGAGKTTLFNCVSGVLKPNNGTITYEGQNLAGLKTDARAHLGIARTFQNLQLFGSMTVLENLMVPLDAFAKRGMVGDAFKLPRARYEERKAEEQGRTQDQIQNQGTCGSQNIGNLDTGGRIGTAPREVFVFAPNAINIVGRGGCQ